LASKLEKMLKDLLDGNATFCHLETVRETPAGPRAVCRFNGTLREVSIHPEVDLERLRLLKSWEYVTVHQDVVIGYWADDPLLYEDAMGENVEFKGYQSGDAHTVRVMLGPQERIAKLDPALWDLPLTPQQKLVLHRSDPSRAIDTVPLENVQSRFEIPIGKLTTRIEDLAGLEEIAEQLLQDILLRVCCPPVRDRSAWSR
jgi:hypothetical protein